MVLLILLSLLSVVAIVATVVVVRRDGYRRIPRRTASTLES
ncbi:hypothetical protein [Pseudolysinimonas yzui]|jgi:hypothetical protein|nr:hypothetical protein [Pseudolysinimonas yzui]